jgi:hypothetical protein
MSQTGRRDRYSKAERYVAFLLTYLPQLQSYAIFPEPHQETKWRGSVLMATIETLASRPGLCLEFGVYKGGSITACAKKFPDRIFYGFDSFEGFPDDGRKDWKQDFSVEKLPAVPANAKLIKGWFSETLPAFLKQHGGEVGFINIDCDIYSSTRDVFTILHDHSRLKPGVIISFDELINYRGFLFNEMLALFEMLERTGLGLEWICCHKNVRLAPEAIRLRKEGNYPDWNSDIAAGFRQQASLYLTDKPLNDAILRDDRMAAYIRQQAQTLAAMAPDHFPRNEVADPVYVT